MDFRLVEMASKQTDVLFNLFSLKMKYLIRDQTCENWYVLHGHHYFIFQQYFSCSLHYLNLSIDIIYSSKQPVQEWFFISVCHNTLCEKCLEHVKLRGSSSCPVCTTMFDPKQDIITSQNMKKSYDQIEEFIFSLLSLE